MFRRLLGPAAVRVNRAAFVLALVLTPLAFAASGVVLLGYGVFFTAGAALFGLPVYLAIGAPLMWFTVRVYGEAGRRLSVGPVVMAAILADVIAFPIAVLFFWLDGSLVSAVQEAAIYTMLGFFAAMVQGLIFGLLYRWFAGPDSPADVADVFS